jgi:hypothetical protein
MSATLTGTSTGSALSNGLAIEYKAFARTFFEGDAAGVLYLMATCYYPTNGFTIFFEPSEDNPAKFSLMEQPPTGVFLNLVTYYAAIWRTDGVSGLQTLPKHVMIVDAQGEHRIHVHPWS